MTGFISLSNNVRSRMKEPLSHLQYKKQQIFSSSSNDNKNNNNNGNSQSPPLYMKDFSSLDISNTNGANDANGADNGDFINDYDDDDDDDDDDNDCPVPKIRNIIVISDATGVTVKAALERVFSQFDPCCGDDDDDDNNTSNNNYFQSSPNCQVNTKIYSHVREEEKVSEIIRDAATGATNALMKDNAMVVFTFSSPDLRAKTTKMCDLSGLVHVDLLGPLMDRMSLFFGQNPLGLPPTTTTNANTNLRRRRRVTLSNSYFRRIEAVEFTLKADDGSAPWLFAEADVILVGVSRTGKTPLSVVLAQTLALKVANIPLVQEVPPPPALFADDVDSRKVICLTINPNELKRIRTSRLVRSKVRSLEQEQEEKKKKKGGGEYRNKSNYAERDYILRDLQRARELARANDWFELDVTGRAVEETASIISEHLNLNYNEL